MSNILSVSAPLVVKKILVRIFILRNGQQNLSFSFQNQSFKFWGLSTMHNGAIIKISMINFLLLKFTFLKNDLQQMFEKDLLRFC